MAVGPAGVPLICLLPSPVDRQSRLAAGLDGAISLSNRVCPVPWFLYCVKGPSSFARDDLLPTAVDRADAPHGAAPHHGSFDHDSSRSGPLHPPRPGMARDTWRG